MQDTANPGPQGPPPNAMKWARAGHKRHAIGGDTMMNDVWNGPDTAGYLGYCRVHFDYCNHERFPGVWPAVTAYDDTKDHLGPARKALIRLAPTGLHLKNFDHRGNQILDQDAMHEISEKAEVIRSNRDTVWSPPRDDWRHPDYAESPEKEEDEDAGV